MCIAQLPAQIKLPCEDWLWLFERSRVRRRLPRILGPISVFNDAEEYERFIKFNFSYEDDTKHGMILIWKDPTISIVRCEGCSPIFVSER